MIRVFYLSGFSTSRYNNTLVISYTGTICTIDNGMKRSKKKKKNQFSQEEMNKEKLPKGFTSNPLIKRRLRAQPLRWDPVTPSGLLFRGHLMMQMPSERTNGPDMKHGTLFGVVGRWRRRRHVQHVGWVQGRGRHGSHDGVHVVHEGRGHARQWCGQDGSGEVGGWGECGRPATGMVLGHTSDWTLGRKDKTATAGWRQGCSGLGVVNACLEHIVRLFFLDILLGQRIHG